MSKSGWYANGRPKDDPHYSSADWGKPMMDAVTEYCASEKEDVGYSRAWLHHKGRNKHHYEYWIDYKRGDVVTCPMPKRYLAEMLMDIPLV